MSNNNIEVDVAIIKTKQDAFEKTQDKHSVIITDTAQDVINLDKKVIKLATYISIGTNIATAIIVFIIREFLSK